MLREKFFGMSFEKKYDEGASELLSLNSYAQSPISEESFIQLSPKRCEASCKAWASFILFMPNILKKARVFFGKSSGPFFLMATVFERTKLFQDE